MRIMDDTALRDTARGAVIDHAMFCGELGDALVEVHGLIVTLDEHLVIDTRVRPQIFLLQSVDDRGRILSQSVISLVEEVRETELSLRGGETLVIESVGDIKTVASSGLSIVVETDVPTPRSLQMVRRRLRSHRLVFAQSLSHVLLPLYFEDTATPSRVSLQISVTFSPSPLGLPFLVLSCHSNPDFSRDLVDQSEMLLMSCDAPSSSQSLSPLASLAAPTLESTATALPLLRSRENKGILLCEIESIRQLITQSQTDYQREIVGVVSEGALFARLRQTLQALHNCAGTAVSPKPDAELVERMLLVYTRTMEAVGTPRRLVKGFTAFEAHCLVEAAMLWHLQQTMLAMNILAQFSGSRGNESEERTGESEHKDNENDEGLSEKEFLAIRTRFSRYDFSFSGEMHVQDLEDLLADLNGDGSYSREELRVIEGELDPYKIGLCSLKDFLSWWTES